MATTAGSWTYHTYPGPTCVNGVCPFDAQCGPSFPQGIVVCGITSLQLSCTCAHRTAPVSGTLTAEDSRKVEQVVLAWAGQRGAAVLFIDSPADESHVRRYPAGAAPGAPLVKVVVPMIDSVALVVAILAVL